MQFKIGDRVRIKPMFNITGLTPSKFGFIQDFPTADLVWVCVDGDQKNFVRGCKLDQLELIIEDKKISKIEAARMRGAGGAPTRTTLLPEDPVSRKNYPVSSGVLDYFPDAIVAISGVSKAGNDQHNPGFPLQWTRGKSTDEADTCIRHFLQRGTLDTDGIRHTAKAAWRMLAILQKEIEKEQDGKV